MTTAEFTKSRRIAWPIETAAEQVMESFKLQTMIKEALRNAPSNSQSTSATPKASSRRTQ